MFPLKLALRPWKLQPLSQLLTFATLTTLLLLAGFFGSLVLSLPEIRARLDGDHVASVFLDPSMESTNLETVRDQIRVTLGSSAVQVEYVDADGFLNSIKNTQPDLAKEVAALGTEKDWVTPKFFSLRGALTERMVETLRGISGVEAVSFSAKRFKPILENIAAIEWLSRVLFAAIVVAMIAVLTLLGRLNSSIFNEAEQIVSQMGGSNAQARLPAQLNPLLLSGAAGLIAGALLMKLDPWFSAKMVSLSPFLRGLDSASSTSSLAIFGLGLATGALAFFFSPRMRTQAR